MTTYRTATRAELDTLLDWAAAEGWNPGLGDAGAFWAADPGGFFVAEDAGRIVGGISVVNHSDDAAFLGLYIVRPERRGQGIGFALWTHALAHAGARTVGLDGVEDQQANYATSGFVPAGATTRYTGAVTAHRDPAITPAADPAPLIAREAICSGTAKPAYLSAWFAQSDTRQTLTCGNPGDPDGFCTVRQCRDGAKIGPLWARDIPTAERLIRHAASLYTGPITLDVPEPSTALATLCQRLDLTPGFLTARMYRGAAPAGSGELFAVTTLELG